MKLLTVCIYEFPAASYDVEHWHERFKEHITHERQLTDPTGDANIKYYKMKEREVASTPLEEEVYCIPDYHFFWGFFGPRPLLELFTSKARHDKFDNFKIVLVGSFDAKKLHSILVFMDYLKSWGIKDAKDV